MATTPYFHWPPKSSAGAGDSDVVAGFGLGGAAPEMAAAVSPDRCAAGVARPRVRRNTSGSGKQQQQQQKGGGSGGAKKPPQRGLGVAELERLRCGGDPLRELAGVVVGGDTGALMHCNHHHPHHVPASAFDARYCPSLLVQPLAASPRPPGCYVHHPPAPGCQRAPAAALAPEQQYFIDRWGRMGPGFTPPAGGNGVVCAAGGDHKAQTMLEPEHPSSQSTIWRSAASSSSSSCCLQSDHRCDLCARRMVTAFAERGAQPPPPAPPSPTARATDYSIYDLAAAMTTTSRQGEGAFVPVRADRKRGALPGEAPAKKEVREIEFFPAASAHDSGLRDGESEFVAPSSSPSSLYGGGAPRSLDLSLRL